MTHTFCLDLLVWLKSVYFLCTISAHPKPYSNLLSLGFSKQYESLKRSLHIYSKPEINYTSLMIYDGNPEISSSCLSRSSSTAKILSMETFVPAAYWSVRSSLLNFGACMASI